MIGLSGFDVQAFATGSSSLKENHDVRPLTHTETHESPSQGDVENRGVANSKSLPSTGKWRCCGCQRRHDIYRLDAGEHLISTLSCMCKHRSCRSCTFLGTVKQFAPIDDTTGIASIPVTSDDGKNNQFGVICRTCGLSWRAGTVQKPKARGSSRRRLSVLPKVNPLQTLRRSRSLLFQGLSHDHRSNDSRPLTGLLTSRSTINLRSTLDPQTKDAKPKPEEQAQGAEVGFYGIECTCGTITDSTSLCFQLGDMTEAADDEVTDNVRAEESPKAARRCGTPELRAKGHGTPMLHLRGISHPNPLRSNPVGDI